MKPIVALVGRPNVGKSTLFNRIVSRRLAVVSEVAGTTRDRLYSDAEWNAASFTVVDTGGIELMEGWHTDPLSEDSERFLPLIRMQAQVAIQDADIIVLVVDGQSGLTAADREVANILVRTKKPVIIAANKLESSKIRDNMYEFYEFGFGMVCGISALHGVGVADLLDELVAILPGSAELDYARDEDDESVYIAILGRPNAGKSTLLNKMIGEERAIVSPIAGTTRDATDTELIWNKLPFTIIDTAGIRRRGKIEPGIEKYSVLRAMKALGRSDVALLLLDAELGITLQDAHIAGMISDEATGVVVVVNKWDAITKDTHTINTFTEIIREQLNFLPYVPILFISAKTGQRVSKILPTVQEVNASRHHRISTSQLNRIVRDAVAHHAHPGKGTRLRFLYTTQVGIAPPTFIFFVNNPKLVHFTYKRYLENRIREHYPFSGTPIRMLFRARDSD